MSKLKGLRIEAPEQPSQYRFVISWSRSCGLTIAEWTVAGQWTAVGRTDSDSTVVGGTNSIPTLAFLRLHAQVVQVSARETRAE